MVTHNPEEAVYVSDRVIVISERPAIVSEILPVNLLHPRSFTDPEFIRIREEVTRKVQEKQDYGQ
jgi:ABC-type nitrate/sulfonate/bicarbonate transport system ATPase subunit